MEQVIKCELKLYAFEDTVKERFDSMTLAYTDKDAIRRFLLMNGGQRPLNDINIYQIGDFDEKNGKVIPIEKRKVDKWIYCLPENKEEELKDFNPENKENK